MALPGNSQPFGLLPSVNQPIIGAGGIVTVPWFQFFTAIVGQPQAIKAVAPSTSPFSYTASQKGSLAVSGGTVSAIALTRGRVTVSTGQTIGLISLQQGDMLSITYSAAPILNFIPG